MYRISLDEEMIEPNGANCSRLNRLCHHTESFDLLRLALSGIPQESSKKWDLNRDIVP